MLNIFLALVFYAVTNSAFLLEIKGDHSTENSSKLFIILNNTNREIIIRILENLFACFQ